MGEKRSTYNVLVVLVAAISSVTYGYCLVILSNSTSNPNFYVALNLDPTSKYTESLMSAFFCLMFVGAMIGCGLYTWVARVFGRRLGIATAEALIVVGGALQAGCVNSAMLCVARVITGMGLGIVVGAVPLYQAEISPPHGRGLLVGLHGSLLGFGISLAQWVTVACFHLEGQAGWRIPLAMQCVLPLVLLCLIWFLPESPRWYYTQGRHEEALKVLTVLHRDPADPSDSFAKLEYAAIKAQLDFEKNSELSVMQMIANPSLRKRFIIGWLAGAGLQSGAALVILTYQGVIYTSLGFTPFLIGVMTGVWGTCNALGNFVGALIVDKVGRKLQMICGHTSLMFCLIMETILIALYAGTSNSGGNSAAVFFLFATIVCYSVGVESVMFIYVSEIFPYEWRAAGVAFSVGSNFLWATIFTAVASPAFANITWRFYIVFACTSGLMALVVFFYFPETKNLSLEEMGRIFGDNTVPPTNLSEEKVFSIEQKGDGLSTEEREVEGGN